MWGDRRGFIFLDKPESGKLLGEISKNVRKRRWRVYPVQPSDTTVFVVLRELWASYLVDDDFNSVNRFC